MIETASRMQTLWNRLRDICVLFSKRVLDCVPSALPHLTVYAVQQGFTTLEPTPPGVSS